MPNQIAWDILLVLITVEGNLCNKYPKWLLKRNSSYSDYFNAISGLYRTAKPQEALWQYWTSIYRFCLFWASFLCMSKTNSTKITQIWIRIYLQRTFSGLTVRMADGLASDLGSIIYQVCHFFEKLFYWT